MYQSVLDLQIAVSYTYGLAWLSFIVSSCPIGAEIDL